jgi:CDP-diacylglycerol---serine O-phosphatidyltransferase
MRTTFSIPNLFSLGNLLCGCFAILKIAENELVWAAYLVGVACVMDFLDGFAARTLKVHSLMGKELDSLADCVTFGIVPALVMVKLLHLSIEPELGTWGMNNAFSIWNHQALAYLGLLIALFSALRLAKFNVDKRQSESFIGLPTLANAIFVCSIPLALGIDQVKYVNLVASRSGGYIWYKQPHFYDPEWLLAAEKFVLNPVFLLGVTLLFSILLLSNIPMFSFKIKSLKWKGNEARYIFLGLSIGLVVWLKLAAIPLIIVLYVLVSMVNTIEQRKVKGKEEKDRKE